MRNTKRYLVVYSTDSTKLFPLAVQILDFAYRGWYWISLIITKMRIYLQISKLSPCAMNNPKVDSGLIKRFFRKFRSFLVPGLRVRKSHISRDKTQFWNFVVILTIFQKSTIFESPLKSVDEGWHWRYKISDLSNHSIITPQNII